MHEADYRARSLAGGASVAIAAPQAPRPRARRTTTRASSCSRSTTSTATSSRPRPGRSRSVAAFRNSDEHGLDAPDRARPVASSTSRRHLKGLRTANTNTITVGAGDLIGASPLISGLFHDEPAIHALNALGLDVSGVGNHEFDEGLQELYRMQFGGCTASTTASSSRSPARSSSTSPRTSYGRRRRDDPPRLRDPEDRQREDRVHRPDPRGDPDDRHAVRGRRPRVPARGRDDERARREAAQRAGRARLRRPAPPGRLPEPAGAGAVSGRRRTPTATRTSTAA